MAIMVIPAEGLEGFGQQDVAGMLPREFEEALFLKEVDGAQHWYVYGEHYPDHNMRLTLEKLYVSEVSGLLRFQKALLHVGEYVA